MNCRFNYFCTRSGYCADEATCKAPVVYSDKAEPRGHTYMRVCIGLGGQDKETPVYEQVEL